MRAGKLRRNINDPCRRGELKQLNVTLEEKSFFLCFPLPQLGHLTALQMGATALLLGSLRLSFKKRKETAVFRDGK